MTERPAQPAVSFLMPVYNASEFVGAAIDGVLSQTFKNFEFVIVNDGSTDETEDIIAKYSDPRIRVLNIEHGGITPALNVGLKACRAPLIARIDADDVCYPNRLAVQLARFEQTGADVIWANANLIDDDGAFICRRHQPSEETSIRLLEKSNFLMHPTALLKKETVIAVGGYDEAFESGQDWALWKTLKARGASFALCDVPLIDYRISQSSMSFKNFRQPNSKTHRNALTCLKNRDRKNFWRFYKSNRSFSFFNLYLLVRYITGESVVFQLRMCLKKWLKINKFHLSKSTKSVDGAHPLSR